MRYALLALASLGLWGCADSAQPLTTDSQNAGAAAPGGGKDGGGPGGNLPVAPGKADAAMDDRSDANQDGGGPSDVPEAGPEFGLTSPVLTDGGEFPEKHSCNGEDISPALQWGTEPQGTQSYALIFTDLDSMIPGDSGPFVHWALFNIPKGLTQLPENIGDGAMPATVPGATQVRAWSALGGAVGGSQYLGPCPREPHHYEFALYALSVPKLEGMDQNRQPTEVNAIIQKADFVLAKTTLTGLYTPP